MRGDRYRQCLPRRSDLCPIPKISDIFSPGGDVRFTARIKPSSSRNGGRAFLLRCFLFVASVSGETSVILDDEFVRSMAAHRGNPEVSIYSRVRYCLVETFSRMTEFMELLIRNIGSWIVRRVSKCR